MCAVYAFMRYCDDLSDEPGANRAAIERWRAALDEALAGRCEAHPVLPALHDTVTRYNIPARYFYEMIDGVTSIWNNAASKPSSSCTAIVTRWVRRPG